MSPYGSQFLLNRNARPMVIHRHFSDERCNTDQIPYHLRTVRETIEEVLAVIDGRRYQKCFHCFGVNSGAEL